MILFKDWKRQKIFLISFRLYWVFVAACGLSLVVAHRLLIVLASLVVEHLGLFVVVCTGLVAPCVESTWVRDQTHVPCISRWTLILWTTREVQKILMLRLER